MHLYQTVDDLITEIEARSEKYLQDSAVFTGKGIAHQVAAASDRARAAILRDVAAQLRDTAIGSDLNSAVLLTEVGAA